MTAWKHSRSQRPDPYVKVLVTVDYGLAIVLWAFLAAAKDADARLGELIEDAERKARRKAEEVLP